MPTVSRRIDLVGTRHGATAHSRHDQNGVEELSCLYGTTDDGRWQCNIRIRDNEKTIYDERTGESVVRQAPLTPTERALALCPFTAIGEFAALADRLRALLRELGYGEIT